MLFHKFTWDVSRTKSIARRYGPLRFEPLERRELLTAATAGDFSTLQALAQSGQDYEITLTADIIVGAGDTIAIGGTGIANISILGNGHSITVTGGTKTIRTASLFYVTNSSLTISGLTIDGFAFVDVPGDSGAVFHQIGGTITINDGTVISNCSADHGSVADIESGTFIVNGGTISNNTAGNRGGVAYVESGTFTVNGGSFLNNTAYNGGVIYADTQFTVITVSDGSFSGNSAHNGGVACVESAKLTIGGGTFSGNRATDEGGVIFTSTSVSEVTIDDGRFTGNSADMGGVAYISAGKFTINGGEFSDNTASARGGVVHTDVSSATVTVNDGSFTGNKALRGGVACINAGKIEIKAGTFSNNTATSAVLEDGGAVIFSDTSFSKVVISGGTFSNNRSMRDGGVICSRGEVTVKGGEISGNTAAKAGGVIFADQGNVYILDGAVITSNSASIGGVACSVGQRTVITFEGGLITKNTAVNGGVLCVSERSAAVINGGTFGGTTGETPWKDGNSAKHGGAVFVIDATASINGGTFAWNSATLNGGAVCVTNHDDDLGPAEDGNTSASITGGSFTHNTAFIGGALYVGHVVSLQWTTTVHLGAVTMEYNNAANGGAIANRGAVVTDTDTAAGGSTVKVKTFTGNSAKYNTGTEENPIWIGNGGAIFNSGKITLSNTVFSSNYSVGNGGAVDNLVGGELTLTGGAFSGNSALASAVSIDNVDWAGLTSNAGDGGALQNWGEATLTDAYFTGNVAHDGGAIANGEGATLTLSQTEASDPDHDAPLGFNHNGAIYGGAIINVGTLTRLTQTDENDQVVLEGSTIEFARNFSCNNGGAISNSDNDDPIHPVTTGSLDLYGASFTSNTAGTAGSGGAIISAKPLTITDSTFTGNSAGAGGKGGAIDQTAAALVLTGDTFTGNSASNTGFGGAVNTWAGGTITDCTFDSNTAKFGGAVSALGSAAATTITHSASESVTRFSNNSAVSYGGAVYASGTVEIDGAAITNNTAALGGGVMAITSDLIFTTGSGASTTQKGRGKVIFTGTATTFSGNNATTRRSGQSVGTDLCATSSNSAEGNGAVIEIATLPSFASGGYAVAVDRSILVLASGVTLPSTLNVYYNRETTCGYTYDGSTLTFTDLSSHSGIDKWRIYWSGSAQEPYTEYDGTGTPPSGTLTGTTVLIEGYKEGTSDVIYYMIPTVNTQASGASEALLDEALFDDAELFEGLAPSGSALEEYCDECFL